MKTSLRHPEAGNRHRKPDCALTAGMPEHRDSILASTHSLPYVRFAIAAVVFVIAAIVAWACLTWLSDASRAGNLLDSGLIGRAIAATALVGLAVLIVGGVFEFRRLRNRVREGRGLIGSPKWILGGGGTGSGTGKTADEEADTEWDIAPAPDTRPAGGPVAEAGNPAERIGALHDEAARRIERFNGEMERLFPRWQQRIQAYEDRVDQLERELAAKESENSELVQRQIELVKQHLEIARERVVDEERQEIAEACSRLEPGTPPDNGSHPQARQLVDEFRQQIAGLNEQEQVKAFEQRIARLESELAGADAEARELSWNQLLLMQSSLEALRSNRKPAAQPGAYSGTARGFQTEIRRRAALRVAELNERIARMHPDYEDRLSAYEQRLRRLEEELHFKDAANEELIRCQIEMSRDYMRLLKGDPGMPQGGPNTAETVNRLFSLQHDLSDVQQEAARRVAAFNSRLHSSNSTREEEVAAYRDRIAELEATASREDAESRDLDQAQLELVRHHLELLGTDDRPELAGASHPAEVVDENGLPVVRIPRFQRANLKEELPREIKALLERKPVALRIRRPGGESDKRRPGAA